MELNEKNGELKSPKSKVQTFLKKSLTYFYIGGSLIVGFYVGGKVSDYKNAIKPKTEVKNFYNVPFSNSDISIAVNESNQLILIERKSGNYKVYSDSIGKSIFNMYVDRIHQSINNNE